MPKVHSYLILKLLLLVSIQFQNKNNVSSFPFLHSTCSLSNLYIYLGFENGFPKNSDKITHVLSYSINLFYSKL